MHANAIAGRKALNFGANLLNNACDLMPERERQGFYWRNSRPVMRIGMANPSGIDADQDIVCANYRHLDIRVFQRGTDCDEANCSHPVAAALLATPKPGEGGWATRASAIAAFAISHASHSEAATASRYPLPEFNEIFPGQLFHEALQLETQER
jgi:hypothetical protein